VLTYHVYLLLGLVPWFAKLDVLCASSIVNHVEAPPSQSLRDDAPCVYTSGRDLTWKELHADRMSALGVDLNFIECSSLGVLS
jgi:hypothetical protein